MTMMQQYLDYSLISFAAYGEDLKENSKNTDALIQAKFTQSQVDQFVNDGWQVVDQSKDSLYGSSGFSATLFYNANTNEYVFANRGSGELQDFFVDGWGIATLGLAASHM